MKKLFTLIELIVVIVVIGILAIIVIPQIATWQKEAKDARLIADIRNTQTAVDMYYSKNGRYPSTVNKTFVNKPIDWEETVPNYLRKKPTIENDNAFYIDPNGTVVLNKGSQAEFLRWLRESPFIVTNPADENYKGINPPKGSVLHNFNLKTDKFETHDNRVIVKSFTSAMVADSLLETYQATADEVYLSRASEVGKFLSSMIQQKTFYGKPISTITPQLSLSGGNWVKGDGEFYLQDMAITAHILIELGELTGDEEFTNKGKDLLDSLIIFQEFVKGSEEFPELSGALPFFLVNQGSSVIVAWSKFPLDIASFVYDAGQSGYTLLGYEKYKTFKDDYFDFVERSFDSLDGISPEGYPYEYIYTEGIGNVYGVNIDQSNGDKMSPSEPFTTDQFFYVALGLMKQDSKSAKEVFQKATALKDGSMFWGQYNPDGTKGSIYHETFNTAAYIEMAKYYGIDDVDRLEESLLTHMLKGENPSIHASWAWSPNEHIVEDLVSAYAPKSLVYQPSLQSYNRK